MVLVGNKCDLVDERQIPKAQGEETARQNDLMYVEASAKTGHNVETAFRHLIDSVYA